MDVPTTPTVTPKLPDLMDDEGFAAADANFRRLQLAGAKVQQDIDGALDRLANADEHHDRILALVDGRNFAESENRESIEAKLAALYRHRREIHEAKRIAESRVHAARSAAQRGPLTRDYRERVLRPQCRKMVSALIEFAVQMERFEQLRDGLRDRDLYDCSEFSLPPLQWGLPGDETSFLNGILGEAVAAGILYENDPALRECSPRIPRPEVHVPPVPKPPRPAKGFRETLRGLGVSFGREWSAARE